MKKIIKTPIDTKELEKLKLGDLFYLSGHLVLARDSVHKRLIQENAKLNFNLKDMAIMHAGPIVKEINGKYEMVSVGPTTSMRMEALEKEFIEETKIKLVIGKGGMGKKTQEACRDNKAVHAIFPGGCAVLASSLVKEIEGVEWLDLGMAEAFWILRVEEFGPLIVSIDTDGNNIFDQLKLDYEIKKLEEIERVCKL